MDTLLFKNPAHTDLSRYELCRRLRQRCLRNLIAASAAESEGNSGIAERYRRAARVLSEWAEELLAAEPVRQPG